MDPLPFDPTSDSRGTVGVTSIGVQSNRRQHNVTCHDFLRGNGAIAKGAAAGSYKCKYRTYLHSDVP